MTMLRNKTFYPTPRKLIKQMISKIQGEPSKILEPSAGKGDIIAAMTDEYDHHYHGRRFWGDISAIEIDLDLQATLRGKGIKVIDSDFLLFSGPDQFDLIIANPPFDNGDLHLLKAIDILYRGEIVFLLNAETIRNPYTRSRSELVKKLSELKAEVEYIPNAFKDAERPVDVEAALVYIKVDRNVEDDLFKEATDTVVEESPEIEGKHEVSTKKTIEELVSEYKEIIRIGTETIVNYYRNYKKIGGYIGLNREAEKSPRNGDLTDQMQSTLNELLKTVRCNFWRRTLDLREVRTRMTTKRSKEFEEGLKQHCDMDFTEGNIRQFILNLIDGFEQTLTDAVLEVFDKFTVAHCYSGGLYDDNIHYFNGWKTNSAFKVKRKVIIPLYGGYGKGPFVDDFSGKWKLQYGCDEILRDIDIVMNYFDGMNSGYYSTREALEHGFERGESRNIEATYFTITAYKKGTLHLTFNDPNILRRFNVAACRGKEWLPHDYGKKPYEDCAGEEKVVIDSFEGAESYTQNLNQPLFPCRNRLRIDFKHMEGGRRVNLLTMLLRCDTILLKNGRRMVSCQEGYPRRKKPCWKDGRQRCPFDKSQTS